MQNSDTTTEGTRAGEDASLGDEASFSQEIWQELQRAQQLATQVSSWSGTFVSLAWLEAKRALHNLPKMLGIGFALIPLALLTWISLSLLLAWLAYVATGEPTIGFVALFALQLTVSLLCVWQLKRLGAQSTLPETREQLRLFLEELKHNPEASARDNSTANRP